MVAINNQYRTLFVVHLTMCMLMACSSDDFAFFKYMDLETQKFMCRNLEINDSCGKFDEEYDPTYGMKAIDLEQWSEKYYVNKFSQKLWVDEIEALLGDRDYAVIEDYIESVQLSLELQEITEYEYDRLLSVFSNLNPSQTKLIDEWVSEKPDSFAAHAARGLLYHRLGWKARGSKFSNKTASDKMALMRKNMQESRLSLEMTVKIRPTFVLGYSTLIDLAMVVGDERAVKKNYLQDSLLASPNAFLPRIKYLYSLRPRWGGSHLEMRKFALSEQQYASQQPMIRTLLGVEYEDRGQLVQEDFKRMIELYSLALHHGAVTNWLWNRAWAYVKINDHKNALKDWSLLSRQHPNNPVLHVASGKAQYQLQNIELAFIDFQTATAVDPNHGPAWQEIGWYYFHHKKEFKKAIDAFKRALEIDSEDHFSKYKFAWSYIELQDPNGLEIMREYLLLCEKVLCRENELKWAREWVDCIDESGPCSMRKSDFIHWRIDPRKIS